jgi:NAD-dependent dihydropyrimidine dehydrogenase PreA subunit
LTLKYPKTLPAFLKKRLLRTYDPLERGVVSSVRLFLLGSSFRSGKTPSYYPLFIQKTASQVPPGLSPMRLLSLVNLTIADGDAVILGSRERGISTGRLNEGLSSKIEGIFLIKNIKKAQKGTCSLCGRCKAACPQGLPVDLLGMSPERKWKEILLNLPDLYNCPACGLCAQSCPENIPLSSLRSLWGDLKL